MCFLQNLKVIAKFMRWGHSILHWSINWFLLFFLVLLLSEFQNWNNHLDESLSGMHQFQKYHLLMDVQCTYVKDFLYSRQKQDFRKYFRTNGKTSLVLSEKIDLYITMWESFIFCQIFCQIKKSGNIWTVTKWLHMADIPLSVWFQLIKTKSLIIKLDLDWDGKQWWSLTKVIHTV